MPLSPQAGQNAVTRMATQHFDLVVVGGGVTGAGVDLDAVTRGLTVALDEARDYAAGTPSRSSKLIHGGLRYLEQFNFGLVREALRERALLLERLCPHLVHPVRSSTRSPTAAGSAATSAPASRCTTCSAAAAAAHYAGTAT